MLFKVTICHGFIHDVSGAFFELRKSAIFQSCSHEVIRGHSTFLDIMTVVSDVSKSSQDSNLVDSASSHTLVSKIKPCMSKYKYFTLKLRTAHYISFSLFDSLLLLGYP